MSARRSSRLSNSGGQSSRRTYYEEPLTEEEEDSAPATPRGAAMEEELEGNSSEEEATAAARRAARRDGGHNAEMPDLDLPSQPRPSRKRSRASTSRRGGDDDESDGEFGSKAPKKAKAPVGAKKRGKSKVAAQFAAPLTDEESRRMVVDFVRLMLYKDRTKDPVVRSTIRKQLVGPTTVSAAIMTNVIANGRRQLAEVFGMELVAVTRPPTKERPDRATMDALDGPDTGKDNRAKTLEAKGAPAFILNSHVRSDVVARHLGDRARRQEVLSGILTVVYAMLSTSNGSMAETVVMERFAELGLPKGRRPMAGMEPIEKLLGEYCVRTLYLIRKRDEHGVFKYHMGPRGKQECDDLQIAKFVANVHGDELDQITRKELMADRTVSVSASAIDLERRNQNLAAIRRADE